MTPYPKDPIIPKRLNLEYYHKFCQKVFGEDYITNADQTNDMMGGTDMKIDNIVFSNQLILFKFFNYFLI